MGVTVEGSIAHWRGFAPWQEARKFARHAKRRRLNPDDINHALKSRNLEVMRLNRGAVGFDRARKGERPLTLPVPPH